MGKGLNPKEIEEGPCGAIGVGGRLKKGERGSNSEGRTVLTPRGSGYSSEQRGKRTHIRRSITTPAPGNSTQGRVSGWKESTYRGTLP